jgi:hypothetical protein
MKIFSECTDSMKSPAQIRREADKKCIICNDHLTIFKGIGSNKLCRKHQTEQREWGGLGRIDRPHTFHRKFECDDCGYKPLEDERLVGIQDEDIKRQVARVLMHGDHNRRRTDGGDDSANNISSLCYVCHAKKTILEEDYKKIKEHS